MFERDELIQLPSCRSRLAVRDECHDRRVVMVIGFRRLCHHHHTLDRPARACSRVFLRHRQPSSPVNFQHAVERSTEADSLRTESSPCPFAQPPYPRSWLLEAPSWLSSSPGTPSPPLTSYLLSPVSRPALTVELSSRRAQPSSSRMKPRLITRLRRSSSEPLRPLLLQHSPRPRGQLEPLPSREAHLAYGVPSIAITLITTAEWSNAAGVELG